MGHTGTGPFGSSNDRRVEPFMEIPNADLWFERYAELLGCEPRPGAIAAAIEMLKSEVERIPAEIARNRKAARDSLIHEMRRTAVNCGHSSTCSVAKWFKTSEETEVT